MKKTLTLLLLLAANLCFAQKNKIQLNLKLDSTYHLSNRGSMDVTENIQGHKLAFTFIISLNESDKVVDIADSTYELAVQYENINALITFDMDGNHRILANT